MTRKLTLLVVASLLLASAGAPLAVAAGSSSPTSPPVKQYYGLFGSPPDDVVRYGGTPSWVVSVENGSLGTLENWANASDDRRIIKAHNASNTATVAAPVDAMGVKTLDRWLDNGLAAKSYVTSISINALYSYAEPVEPQSEGNVSDGLSRTERWRAEGSYSTNGVAFAEDANKTTLKEARNITGADQVTETGSGITIAVIDTGVNTANGRVFGNGSYGSALRISSASKDFVENQTVKQDGIDAVADPNGHGTHVASTLAANTTNASHDGMAPDATLLVLRALNAEGQGSSSDIAAAIRYAADHNASVISMSLGSPVYSKAIADAIKYAVDQGSVVVIAAGNSRQTTRWLASPADTTTSGVISVAASNGTSATDAGIAYFSQLGHDPGTTDLSDGATTGAGVDVSAPGMKLVAKTPTTDETVTSTTLSGTSMATPVVAGGIALMMANETALQGQPAWIESNVTDAARPIPHAAVAEAGNGMLAVDNAVEDIDPDDQGPSMTSAAYSRERTWRTLSDSSGGLVMRFLVTATPRWSLVTAGLGVAA